MTLSEKQNAMIAEIDGLGAALNSTVWNTRIRKSGSCFWQRSKMNYRDKMILCLDN